MKEGGDFDKLFPEGEAPEKKKTPVLAYVCTGLSLLAAVSGVWVYSHFGPKAEKPPMTIEKWRSAIIACVQQGDLDFIDAYTVRGKRLYWFKSTHAAWSGGGTATVTEVYDPQESTVARTIEVGGKDVHMGTQDLKHNGSDSRLPLINGCNQRFLMPRGVE